MIPVNYMNKYLISIVRYYANTAQVSVYLISLK